MNEEVKTIVDGLSIATLIGTLAQALPPLAALVTLVWGLLRIYDWLEARGVVDWFGKRKENNDASDKHKGTD